MSDSFLMNQWCQIGSYCLAGSGAATLCPKVGPALFLSNALPLLLRPYARRPFAVLAELAVGLRARRLHVCRASAVL